jgi:hypothetical protein
MICPFCNCPDWYSVEKNKDGVNMRVRCRDCGAIYQTRFRSELFEYRLADGHIHGRIMREVKIPNDTGVFRVWVSQDRVTL